jgi:hypothetical protein
MIFFQLHVSRNWEFSGYIWVGIFSLIATKTHATKIFQLAYIVIENFNLHVGYN